MKPKYRHTIARCPDGYWEATVYDQSGSVIGHGWAGDEEGAKRIVDSVLGRRRISLARLLPNYLRYTKSLSLFTIGCAITCPLLSLLNYRNPATTITTALFWPVVIQLIVLPAFCFCLWLRKKQVEGDAQ